ncbi:MAG: carotenoid biosynthesis protein, partial [Thermodesulfobacteriota bacterium]|nr:carotenoid biosynthesis protein [Thermodesulfobacteriota bacterium]
MNDSNIGKWAFILMIILTVIGVVALSINAFLPIDLVPMMMSPKWLLMTFVVLTAFVLWNSVLTKGWGRSLLALALAYIIAFTAEALGVNFGLVFGRYYYTDALGIKFIGVSLMVALAWEPILYASFGITDILIPSSVERSDSL